MENNISKDFRVSIFTTIEEADMILNALAEKALRIEGLRQYVYDSVNEQVNYICERGKINLELIQMQDKINVAKKDREAMQEIYVNLIYEKAMLDSYYKTRTKAKDEYFLDESQKDSLGSDIIIAVTNLLPKQAFSLLQKDNKLTIQQENELEAIVALLNAQQIQTIEKMINSVPNGGLKKSMSKRLKNMVS